MGMVLSKERRDEIQRKIRRIGLDQIILDFVIDLSPFIVPSDGPLGINHDDDKASQASAKGLR